MKTLLASIACLLGACAYSAAQPKVAHIVHTPPDVPSSKPASIEPTTPVEPAASAAPPAVDTPASTLPVDK